MVSDSYSTTCLFLRFYWILSIFLIISCLSSSWRSPASLLVVLLRPPFASSLPAPPDTRKTFRVCSLDIVFASSIICCLIWGLSWSPPLLMSSMNDSDEPGCYFSGYCSWTLAAVYLGFFRLFLPCDHSASELKTFLTMRPSWIILSMVTYWVSSVPVPAPASKFCPPDSSVSSALLILGEEF